ncbi:hypothetical protein NR402_17970 [Acidithiobacillus ferrooxidans]|uniref:hypothetical protein n=1 Tax=Acidithiobacillus ferrooxidans TaxID=920 RepID=UPI00214C8F80|nr:hypothetical protein [Acidithiobacillus ferrooxidans]MCR2832133.1 hypothetical protein [Acidithiobacillus ferrooxidans]
MHETTGNNSSATDEGLTPEHQKLAESGTIPVSPLKSRKITSVISGEDYMDYVILCERLDFGNHAKKLSTRDIDDRVIHLALLLLKREVGKIRQKTGNSFVSVSTIEKQQ